MGLIDFLFPQLIYCSGIGFAFLAWTLWAYGMHRLAHIHSRHNPIWRIHSAHHKEDHFPSLGKLKFCWSQLFLWTGSLTSSLDIYLTLTLPAVLLVIMVPQYGWPVFLFHYVYEVFLSDAALDHNLHLKGPLTRIFAWGETHLLHHVHLRNNYGLIITLWDRVFRTYREPEVNFVLNQIEMKRQKGLLPGDFSIENWPEGNIFGSTGAREWNSSQSRHEV